VDAEFGGSSVSSPMERNRVVSHLGLLVVVGVWLFSLMLSAYPLFYHDRSFAREKSFSTWRNLAGERTRFCDLLSEDDEIQRGGWWWTLTQMVMAQTDSDICTDDGPAKPSWEGLKGGEHCLRYATREYTAKLVNIPSDADALKTCRETPVGIHGAALFPDFCQDLVSLVRCGNFPLLTASRAHGEAYGGTGSFTLMN
jgi:hypothetical protein